MDVSNTPNYCCFIGWKHLLLFFFFSYINNLLSPFQARDKPFHCLARVSLLKAQFGTWSVPGCTLAFRTTQHAELTEVLLGRFLSQQWRRHSFNNVEGGRPPVLWPKEVGGVVSNDEMSSLGQMAKIRAGKMIIRWLTKAALRVQSNVWFGTQLEF